MDLYSAAHKAGRCGDEQNEIIKFKKNYTLTRS